MKRRIKHIQIQQVLINIGVCRSHKEAGTLLAEGKVKLNGKILDRPWFLLKGGYYTLDVQGHAVYRFGIWDGVATRFKVEYYDEKNNDIV